MFKFRSKQQTFNIGGVKVGGNPGENPTVLIGTIFYSGQKIFRNEERGDFDRRKAESLINKQEEFSDKTGNPCMLDVVGAAPNTIKKLIEFTAGATNNPILIGGTTAEVRIAGLEYAEEVGLINRVVYNSLAPKYKQEELEKIREAGVKSAILFAYNVEEFTTAGRIKAVKGLLRVACGMGIDRPLIDTFVLDIPSLGTACEAIFELKNDLGLPIGCGAHNAISTWRGLKAKMGEQAVKPSIASACVFPVAVGADFLLYGPIEDAGHIFPAVAMVNAAYGHLLLEGGIKLDLKHPIFRIA